MEFRVIGNAVKVSALDPETLLEVSILGPSTASQADLSRLAVRKLEYRLRKRVVPKPRRRGIVV